jgi:hypothetical protein
MEINYEESKQGHNHGKVLVTGFSLGCEDKGIS